MRFYKVFKISTKTSNYRKITLKFLWFVSIKFLIFEIDYKQTIINLVNQELLSKNCGRYSRIHEIVTLRFVARRFYFAVTFRGKELEV